MAESTKNTDTGHKYSAPIFVSPTTLNTFDLIYIDEVTLFFDRIKAAKAFLSITSSKKIKITISHQKIASSLILDTLHTVYGITASDFSAFNAFLSILYSPVLTIKE